MSQELLNHKSKCRLCFKRISVSRNTSKITENVQQKFLRLTNVELKSSDKYSNSICKTCIKSLNESSHFQQQMIDNQQRLYAFENENKLIVKIEPIQSNVIELQEIFINDFLPKTEIFDDCCVKDQSWDLPDFEEASSPVSPDSEILTTEHETNENISEKDDATSDPTIVRQTKRIQKAYQPDQLFNAVEAVALGELSAKAAAKKFNVPRTTVRKKLQQDHHLLTDQEELQVKLYVNRRTEAGRPSSDEDIEKFVLFRLLCKRRGKDKLKIKSLSRTWISNFRKRHSDMNVLEKQTGVEYSCDVCGFSVEKKKHLRIHMNFHVSNPKTVRRDVFKKYSPSDLETAAKLVADKKMTPNAAAKLLGIPRTTLRRKLANEIQKCSYCSKIYFNSWTLRDHIKLHLEPEGEFKCEVCEKVFLTRRRLESHKLFHKLGVFKCTRCDTISHSKSDADKHIRTHRPLVACDVCGKLVFKGASFTHHMKTHGEPQFKCTFEGCSRAYYVKYMLGYHTENSHGANQNIKCSKCDATFPNKIRLKAHESRIHIEARFFCMVEGCRYKNRLKQYLRLHLRNHKDIDVKYRDELIASLKDLK